MLLAIANSIIFIIVMGETGISSGYMIKKRRWLFLFTKTTKYQLLDIKDVEIESTRHKSIVYRATITLASGKKIPLSTYYANYLKSKNNLKATADEIRSFLSLPRY